jgi:membrane-associated phospholipid phosphatase
MGDYSPEIIQLISFCLIALSTSKNIWIIAYIIGIIINNQINKLLKYLTRQNMPSGHFQAIFFAITFTYLVLRKTDAYKHYWIYVLILYLIISALCFYNCIKYKYHNILEILAGSIMGGATACLAFYLLSKIYL